MQYCIMHLIFPQTSGLATTTTATSCIAQHSKGGIVVTHLDAITTAIILALVFMVSLTYVLFRVFAQGNIESDTLSPPSYIILLIKIVNNVATRF